MNNDMVLSLVRSVLKVGGGMLVAKGLTDAAGSEQLVGAVVSIIGVVWGMLHRKTATSTTDVTKP